MLFKKTVAFFCSVTIAAVSLGQVNKTTTKTTTTTTTTKSTPAKSSKSTYVFTRQDSLDAIEELVGALGFLYDSLPRPFSSGSVSVGVGKGYFTPRGNSSAANPVNKFYYSASGNYMHKTGLGLSVRGLFLPENANLNLFQTTVSPSYDYIKSKKIGFGFSYTHYFIKDSLSFETSPLLNEYYGYLSYKKSFLRPMIGVNYATGTIHEHQPATLTTPEINSTTKVSDVAVIASVQHYFNWKSVLTSKDQLTFGPTLMTVAGTSKYGTNLSIGTLGKAVISNIVNNTGNGNAFGKAKKKKKKKDEEVPILTPPTTEEYVSNTDFGMQGVTLILGANYAIKRFYVQPQVLFDYTIPDATKKFNTLFNATLGVNF
jgi:hypothetical protein